MRAIFAATLVTLLAGTAVADDAGFTIRNPSSTPIHYEVKWGDGDWRPARVDPGHTRLHTYPLDDSGRSPRPTVRFDWIAGDGRVTFREYAVNTFRVCNPADGKPHHFDYSACGRFLDLYSGR